MSPRHAPPPRRRTAPTWIAVAAVALAVAAGGMVYGDAISVQPTADTTPTATRTPSWTPGPPSMPSIGASGAWDPATDGAVSPLSAPLPPPEPVTVYRDRPRVTATLRATLTETAVATVTEIQTATVTETVVVTETMNRPEDEEIP